MHGYTKLFNSILHSTIWSEPNEVRILWITMLAMADKYGDVNASVPGLARMAGITTEQAQDGLTRFLSPDQYSRTPDNEGRRISEIKGGWHLLNHGHYRALMSAEERKEYNRVKQAERRAKISYDKCQNLSKNVNDESMTVNDNKQNTHITEAEADTKAEGNEYNGAFGEFWKCYPKKVGKDAALKAWKKRKGIDEKLLIILEALETQKNSVGWKKDFGQFIPNPATWLNEGRWQDEVSNNGHQAEQLRAL